MRSVNRDMYWRLLNMCWESSGFGLGGGFNIRGGSSKRGRGLGGLGARYHLTH